MNIYGDSMNFELIVPTGPESCTVTYSHFSPSCAADVADVIALADTVMAQDRRIVESVQRKTSGPALRERTPQPPPRRTACCNSRPRPQGRVDAASIRSGVVTHDDALAIDGGTPVRTESPRLLEGLVAAPDPTRPTRSRGDRRALLVPLQGGSKPARVAEFERGACELLRCRYAVAVGTERPRCGARWQLWASAAATSHHAGVHLRGDRECGRRRRRSSGLRRDRRHAGLDPGDLAGRSPIAQLQ